MTLSNAVPIFVITSKFFFLFLLQTLHRHLCLPFSVTHFAASSAFSHPNRSNVLRFSGLILFCGLLGFWNNELL